MNHKQISVYTRLKSFSIWSTISHNWQRMPLTSQKPLRTLLFPGSDADTTGEDIQDAFPRRMHSIGGMNGPPRTSCYVESVQANQVLESPTRNNWN